MVRVVFLHPDLGIGGAERLVVDAALALREKGHQVHLLTCHHDRDHCFEETRDGTLAVTCVGDWLPRSFAGRCRALCAYVRMAYAALYLVFSAPAAMRDVDVAFCDQVSACIPLLKFGPNRPRRIVFYCHFPDQLLTNRETFFKKLYRAPLDWIEEATTGMADVILVNSRFTAGVFRETFSTLDVEPSVMYPSLHTGAFDAFEAKHGVARDRGRKVTFLSVNRYERKKNLPLAIRALDRLTRGKRIDAHLVMVGGYDRLVAENVEHFRELQDLASSLGLEDRVAFKTSTPSEEKIELMMKTCDALLYTPSGEHFGIVPLEAMYAQLPVIAVDDGGPKESVAHEETGFLCQPSEQAFAEAMYKVAAGGEELQKRMGAAGRERVRKLFSFSSFAQRLDEIVSA